VNCGCFNGRLFGIPFDCDIQMTHVRKKHLEAVLEGLIDKAQSIPDHETLLRLSAELNEVEPGVAGAGLILGRGF